MTLRINETVLFWGYCTSCISILQIKPKLKKRPALVILDSEDDDLIVARITSQITKEKFEYEIINWKNSGLLLPSVVKLNKIATIEVSNIKKLGKLNSSEILEAKKNFKMICEEI